MVSSKPPPCLGLADADSIRHSLPADSDDRYMVNYIYYRGPLEASPAGILGLSDVFLEPLEAPEKHGCSGMTQSLKTD